jgi:hypothetical protein
LVRVRPGTSGKAQSGQHSLAVGWFFVIGTAGT